METATLAKLVKLARGHSGLTMGSASKLLKLGSRMTLGDIESGKLPVTPEYVLAGTSALSAAANGDHSDFIWNADRKNADAIREAREKDHVNQDDTALALGLTHRAVLIDVEAGRVSVPDWYAWNVVQTILRIAASRIPQVYEDGQAQAAG